MFLPLTRSHEAQAFGGRVGSLGATGINVQVCEPFGDSSGSAAIII